MISLTGTVSYPSHIILGCFGHNVNILDESTLEGVEVVSRQLLEQSTSWIYAPKLNDH